MNANVETNIDLVSTGYSELLRGAFGEAREMLERAHALGDFRASVYLGWLHEDGLGVKRDTQLAIHYYEEALADGDVSVCARLARILEGLNRHADAVRILERGAKAGDGQAIYNLGYVLSDQTTEFYSPNRAAELLASISTSHPFACRRLASLHFARRLTNSSYLAGVKYLMRGAKLSLSQSWKQSGQAR